ncbi:PepSY domain-containing protein [Xenophilus arseniciresistens]|uniref:PepSY domain-containing protein n=1 Tax=Xenophilus arseniciresistens TaxID=1283306 RepID=A0AAE3SZH9_9BURK|nr:PepSY domain-containing protein [Xenophilus arseniciresistens]MDA7416555.1 PepSY domain-containing protein [Xenophilus arseniciresistens]
MTTHAIKTWTWVHKWSSLVCTVFMLLLCLTGLPLIFHHEIGHLLGTEVEAPKMAPGIPHQSLDRILDVARAKHPERVVQFASLSEDDENLWFVTLTPTPAPTDDFRSVAVDARTAQALPTPRFDEGFMWVMFKLHVDLFAGLPGKLFLGLMGLLLLVAIVSGVVLYSPFMRKLDFATVRRDRRPRLKWLDLHNLLGIVTLVWFFVVGATGMINTWADLLIKYWQYDQLSTLLAPYKDQPTVPVAERASLQQSLQVAHQQAPGNRLSFIAFPGTAFSSPHHHTFFLKGNTPLTSRLLQPVLVDARTAEVTAAPKLPWYLTALLVSQPLHFGDYGGMPMQILWAVLDIATIVVLGSGLYLWLKKGNPVNEHRRPPAPAAPVPGVGLSPPLAARREAQMREGDALEGRSA